MTTLPLDLKPTALFGDLQQDAGDTYLPEAATYVGRNVGDGLDYRFTPGALAGANYLMADMLLIGTEAGVFVLELQEGDDGPVFGFLYSLLPQASARMRLPLESVNQNRWMYDREGAWLKPRVQGQRVNLERVDRMRILIYMTGDAPVRWSMTPVRATVDEPPRLEQPLLPDGPLIDELGQSTHRDWPSKSRSVQEVTQRLHQQLADAPRQQWPDGFSRWGGWTGKQFEGTGYFRTQWDDAAQRWWLVDPDGCVFWSTGQDCVRVDVSANITNMESALTWLPGTDDEYHAIVRESDYRHGGNYINYLQANFMRAFGGDWYAKWAEITLAELRRAGFNTVANWSEWEIARDVGFPYVRPMDGHMGGKTPTVYRELPDVFDPQFDADAAEFARQLEETRDDPAFIGYFMMNEPTWGFSAETPAAGMLFNTPSCASRRALADFLRDRYDSSDETLARSWEIPTSFDAIAEGRWNTPFTPAAESDLADFSAIMVEKYFSTLSAACRTVDPHHLNLGVRYHTVPPRWAIEGMRSFDVFSINCYRAQVPADELAAIHDLLNMPTMVGEWHMGALDVGLPATGVGPRVKDQAARAQAYRFYLETAAALPHCVGVHHFTHYDQSALGRFDGEAYNIGFYDVCNRPYEVLVQAARQSHTHMYPIALGERQPFSDPPEFLPRFFF
jgi:hypothetical protein